MKLGRFTLKIYVNKKRKTHIIQNVQDYVQRTQSARQSICILYFITVQRKSKIAREVGDGDDPSKCPPSSAAVLSRHHFGTDQM